MSFSNIELYYSGPSNISGTEIIINGDEFYHVTRVMRHTIDDELYITDGKGNIFQARIKKINRDDTTADVINSWQSENKYQNIHFCIPKIKSSERFEFALEKSVELGITNFIIFESERSYKKGEKSDRWNKILLSAMKQSLRSYLPSLTTTNSLKEIFKYPGDKIVFEQNSENSFNSLLIENEKEYYFIFGPEGGLSNEELNLVSSSAHFKLADNRLRSETAIVTCAALLNTR